MIKLTGLYTNSSVYIKKTKIKIVESTYRYINDKRTPVTEINVSGNCVHVKETPEEVIKLMEGN